MYFTKIKPVLTSLASLFFCATSFGATGYSITFLDDLGGSKSVGAGINNQGQAVGWLLTASGAQHAILWDGAATYDLGSSRASAINDMGLISGTSDANINQQSHASIWSQNTRTDLGTIGGNTSEGLAINSSGQIVGGAYTNNFAAYHAVIWSNGTSTDLGTLPGGDRSEARAINDGSQVVGYSYTSAGVGHATLWSNGTVTDLGTLGGQESYAYGINNAGQIIGWASVAGNRAMHATLWNGDVAIDLGALESPANTSWASAINSNGVIVGGSQVAGGGNHAVLWDKAIALDLNSFLDTSLKNDGWEIQGATDINDQGIIVGNAFNSRTFSSRAVLITPSVPEPGTYPLMLLGLAALLLSRRSCKAD